MSSDEDGNRTPEQVIADWEARMAAKKAKEPPPPPPPPQVLAGGVVIKPRVG